MELFYDDWKMVLETRNNTIYPCGSQGSMINCIGVAVNTEATPYKISIVASYKSWTSEWKEFLEVIQLLTIRIFKELDIELCQLSQI